MMNLLKNNWAILLMLIISILYFKPEFEGKEILGSDSSQGIAKDRARAIYMEKNNESYLWNPGIFSGMSMLHGAVSENNVPSQLNKIRTLSPSKGAFTFFLCMLLSYLLGIKMGFSKLLSFILAFSVTFSLNNIILYKVGHFSKIDTLVFTPLILSGLYLLFEKEKYSFGSILLGLGIAMSIYLRHPQMSYYILLIVSPYFILKIIELIKNREFKKIYKIFIFGTLAVILGIGSNFDRIWNLKVHSDVSMRGKKILKNNGQDKNEKDGLSWEYAMQWSNNSADVYATIVPGYAGGSGAEKLNKTSDLTKKYNMKFAPLYWGGLPFTESPSYIGILFLLLMILALISTKKIWVWGIAIGVIFSVLISYGKNIEWLQRFLFDYLPMYDKFRAPSSILNATVFFVPVVGFWYLNKIKNTSETKQQIKKLTYATFGLILFIILCLLTLPDVNRMTHSGDQRYVNQGLNLIDLINERKELIKSDSLRAIILILLFSSTQYLYFKKRIKYNSMLIVVLALFAFDFLTINNRYYSFDKYQKATQLENPQTPRAVDNQILSMEEKREDYRLLDLSINTYNNTVSSYYHNTIGGYSPVKFIRYQDLIDRHISNKININVLNMLNTKYIINQNGQLQINNQACGTAWFVDNYMFANTPNEEIAILDTLKTNSSAVFFKNEFNDYLKNLNLDKDSTRYITLNSYTPDRIEYTSQTNTEQLVIFSEIWMDGEQWKAKIDGEDVEFARANYILRAMRIPKGKHTITFEFKPKSFYSGGYITLAFGSLFLFFIAYNIWKFYQKISLN